MKPTKSDRPGPLGIPELGDGISTAADGIPDIADREVPGAATGHISQFHLTVKRFRRSKLAVVSAMILVFMYLVAIFAPFLSPNDPQAVDADFSYSAPSSWTWDGGPAICSTVQTIDPVNITRSYETDCSKPAKLHFFGHGFEYKLFGLFTTDVHLFTVDDGTVLPLGADKSGRDIFSRMIYGTRVSMTIGVIGVAIAAVLGSVIGTISGYAGGAVDSGIQRFIEIIMSIPTLPLWATMAAVLPMDMSVTERYFLMTLILSLVTWTALARQVRGKVMGYASADYVAAAKQAGAGRLRIVVTHLVPNSMSHIVAVSMLAIPTTILAETALSFLGIGMQEPAISWGVLLEDASSLDVLSQYPWILAPGAAVILAVTCFQLLGDGIRDAVDPYS